MDADFVVAEESDCRKGEFRILGNRNCGDHFEGDVDTGICFVHSQNTAFGESADFHIASTADGTDNAKGGGVMGALVIRAERVKKIPEQEDETGKEQNTEEHSLVAVHRNLAIHTWYRSERR